ncbi:MAG: DUF4199 domain-containing protein [Henriciella sp.]
MLKRILIAGVAAGLITGGFLFTAVAGAGEDFFDSGQSSHLYGYASMLLALSLIFVAVKRQRDLSQGGVIKFLPAFGMGLAISAVAAVVYSLGWELTLATTGLDFAGPYTENAIATARENGMSGEELAAYEENMRGFAEMYSNPLYRFPITMIEILPVGVLVSLVSAALLRNSNFLPHRPTV